MIDALELLKPEQVAKMFKVSKSNVYALAAKGKLPAIKIGGSLRFRPSTLLEWVQRQEKANYGK